MKRLMSSVTSVTKAVASYVVLLAALPLLAAAASLDGGES
jgi:hypothetical protein